MNRFLFILTFISLFSGMVSAQNPQLCNQVLGASGKSTTLNGRYYAYTVGEVITTTVTGNQRVITQGFHQPDLCLPVSTENVDLAKWSIEAFPNPTDNVLQIRFDGNQIGSLQATVFDLLGNLLLDNYTLDNPGGTTLPCADFAPGVYIVRISESDGKAAASLRFVKI